MPAFVLRCSIQHYDWGSRESIPRLLGLPSPQEKPWAEMWMGAHHKAPSLLSNGESLAAYIERDPRAALGGELALGGCRTLPFLLKILAASGPLSLQCHPNKKQAEAGFDREEAAGIAIDDPRRNYRDRNHKPELIVALEEFWALKGFRSETEIASLFRRAGVTAAEPLLERLEFQGGLRQFFSALLSLGEGDTNRLLTQLASGLKNLPEAEAQWTQELLARYPGDQSATAALVLQLIQLCPGQGLYLGAGELHAYLRGTGLEIMASSDNVLRGGLTSKHVDSEELLSTVRFQYEPLHVVEPQREGTQISYQTPCNAFQLVQLSLDPGQECRQHRGCAEIWLSLRGEVSLDWGKSRLTLSQGKVAFVSADTPCLSVKNLGRGPCQIWIARAGS